MSLLPEQPSHRISENENPFLLLSSSSSLSTSKTNSNTATSTETTLIGALANAFSDCLIANDSNDSKADIDLDQLLQACQRFKENMHAVGQHGNARDLQQNMQKVQQARQASAQTFATVRTLLAYEKQHCDVRLQGGALRNPSAAMGLLWMRRAVHFQYLFNQSLLVQQPPQPVDTVEAALEAYSQSLQPFHSWPLQQVFILAFRTMTPNRSQSLAELWGTKTKNLLDKEEEAIVLEQLKQLADIWRPVRTA